MNYGYSVNIKIFFSENKCYLICYVLYNNCNKLSIVCFYMDAFIWPKWEHEEENSQILDIKTVSHPLGESCIVGKERNKFAQKFPQGLSLKNILCKWLERFNIELLCGYTFLWDSKPFVSGKVILSIWFSNKTIKR